MHEVLVNRLGGLSLPRKSVAMLTDRPDMTLDVYCGRKTTIQQYNKTLSRRKYLRPILLWRFMNHSYQMVFVSLNSDFAQSSPTTILRDTGASQSLILADTLPFSKKTSSGTRVVIQGVECEFVTVPLHNIYLSSDLVNGPVAVGIRQTLHFKGVHLLLGNDLAGDKVVVNPLVTDTPCIDQSPDPIEQELPDLYP